MLVRLYWLHTQVPNLISCICRKKKADMRASVLDQWEKEVLPYDMGDARSPCTVYGGENPLHYDWKNGGRTYIFGLLNPDKYKGMKFDIGYVSQAEESTQDEWEFLAHRITGHAGNWKLKGRRLHQLYADCNPDSSIHFLRDRKRVKVVTTTLDDNILHYRGGQRTQFGEQVDAHLRDTLTGIRYRRLYLGEWCSAEGAVFTEFDEARHVIDRLPADILSWKHYRGIDHGHVSPYVCVWVAHNEITDQMILYKEDRRCGLVVPDRAERILRYSQGIDVAVTWADHEALENEELKTSGVWVELADKRDLLKRLDIIRIRLKKGTLKFYRHALIDRCPVLEENQGTRDTILEMSRYRHKPLDKHVGNSLIDDVPIKADDHGIDPLGYIIKGIDGHRPLEVFEGELGQLSKEHFR